MPDPDDRSTFSDFELAELVGLVGNAFAREGLSPPSQLYSAIRHWRGLSRREILLVLDKHFYDHRQRYLCGSGDGFFWQLEADVRRAIEAKHPRPAPEREPERPQRPRNRVVKLHNPSGFPDAFDSAGREDDRDKGPASERVSVVGDYGDGGEPIDDNQPDA